jgi:glucose-1-phosphate cytidylyltransferase
LTAIASWGFAEKHAGSDGWINGGYLVMEPGVLEYLERDEDRLAAYKHAGFWQCMDTMRDKQTLERLWASDAPPWRRW